MRVTSTWPPTMTASSTCTPTTSPTTIPDGFTRPSEWVILMVVLYLHSRTTGESFTRGGLTLVQDTISMPTRSGSLMPGPNSADDAFITSRSSQVARLATNSPVSSALICECLRGWLENSTSGGCADTVLKKLYGARFTTPALLTVEIQPIGRGTTSAVQGLCGRLWSLRLGS